MQGIKHFSILASGIFSTIAVQFTLEELPAISKPQISQSEINNQRKIYRNPSSLSPAIAQGGIPPRPLLSLNEARIRARTLREHYPKWKDALDGCPCTRTAAQANPRFVDSTNFITTKEYHPGAVWDYRTSKDAAGTYSSPTLPDGSSTLRPGQQCTYGADGLLITDGSGAGTPDAYAPKVTWPGQGLVSDNSHTFWDVDASDAGMSWQEYHQTWTPNNTNRCPTNFVTVFKTNSFVNTGISLNRGDRVKINASGWVKFGIFAALGGPNGIIFNLNYNYFPSVPHGRLMARFRQSGMRDLNGWASIGVGWDELREVKFSSPRTLEFLVNDNQPSDNLGVFLIEVTIRPDK